MALRCMPTFAPELLLCDDFEEAAAGHELGIGRGCVVEHELCGGWAKCGWWALPHLAVRDIFCRGSKDAEVLLGLGPLSGILCQAMVIASQNASSACVWSLQAFKGLASCLRVVQAFTDCLNLRQLLHDRVGAHWSADNPTR